MGAEFKKFLTQSNALALAIGVIIGVATGKVVSAVVDDILMPVIGFLLPAGDWREAKIVLKEGNAILYGHFLGTLIDFIAIAFVVYMIAKVVLKQDPPAG